MFHLSKLLASMLTWVDVFKDNGLSTNTLMLSTPKICVYVLSCKFAPEPLIYMLQTSCLHLVKAMLIWCFWSNSCLKTIQPVDKCFKLILSPRLIWKFEPNTGSMLLNKTSYLEMFFSYFNKWWSLSKLYYIMHFCILRCFSYYFLHPLCWKMTTLFC